ncbi:MAG: phosphatase PAP2 family protein [Candidatus Sericytochromatia bacterium]
MLLNLRNYLITQTIIATCYYIVSHFTIFTPIELPLTSIDLWVKPNAFAVWIYMSFFFLLAMGITWNSKETSMKCIKSALINSLIASFFFFFFPTRITFHEYAPYISEDSLTGHFVKMMKKYDDTSNCFPSLHIANSIIATYFFNKEKSINLKAFATTWLLLVVWSVLSTKQHTIYDVIGGAILSIISIKIVEKNSSKTNFKL